MTTSSLSGSGDLHQPTINLGRGRTTCPVAAFPSPALAAHLRHERGGARIDTCRDAAERWSGVFFGFLASVS